MNEIKPFRQIVKSTCYEMDIPYKSVAEGAGINATRFWRILNKSNQNVRVLELLAICEYLNLDKFEVISNFKEN